MEGTEEVFNVAESADSDLIDGVEIFFSNKSPKNPAPFSKLAVSMNGDTVGADEEDVLEVERVGLIGVGLMGVGLIKAVLLGRVADGNS